MKKTNKYLNETVRHSSTFNIMKANENMENNNFFHDIFDLGKRYS